MHSEGKWGRRGGVGAVQREAGRQHRLVRSQGRHTAGGDAASEEGVMEETAAASLPSCPTPSDPMDCSLPGPSVHGIFQARALEWVPLPSPRAALVVKNLPAQAGDIRDAGSIPGSARSPGGGHGNPLQYSCPENPMDRGAWWATVRGVAKSWTQLK